jgi:hypothetical protein
MTGVTAIAQEIRLAAFRIARRRRLRGKSRRTGKQNRQK